MKMKHFQVRKNQRFFGPQNQKVFRAFQGVEIQ